MGGASSRWGIRMKPVPETKGCMCVSPRPINPIVGGRDPDRRRQACPQSSSNSFLQESHRVSTAPDSVVAKSYKSPSATIRSGVHALADGPDADGEVAGATVGAGVDAG